MYVMTTGAFDFAIVELDTIVETLWIIDSSEIRVIYGQAGITNRDGVIITQIGSNCLDADVMGNVSIMTLAAMVDIVTDPKLHMQRRLLVTVPPHGFENDAINGNRAIVTG